MRIVVTGASGNVGTALLRRLRGEHELVGVVRRPPPPVAPYDGMRWLTSRDEEAMRHTDVRPDLQGEPRRRPG